MGENNSHRLKIERDKCTPAPVKELADLHYLQEDEASLFLADLHHLQEHEASLFLADLHYLQEYETA